MNQKDLLVDRVTMEFQQKQEKTLLVGFSNRRLYPCTVIKYGMETASFLNILPNKGNRPNDYKKNII